MLRVGQDIYHKIPLFLDGKYLENKLFHTYVLSVRLVIFLFMERYFPIHRVKASLNFQKLLWQSVTDGVVSLSQRPNL